MNEQPDLFGWSRLDWMAARHFWAVRKGPLLYQALCGQEAYLVGNIYPDAGPKCPECVRLLAVHAGVEHGGKYAQQ